MRHIAGIDCQLEGKTVGNVNEDERLLLAVFAHPLPFDFIGEAFHVKCGGDALMGCGSSIAGGGYFGFEQFVSYDPNDTDSIKACIKNMDDAIQDCKDPSIPLGKEYIYLMIGWSDERIWTDMAKMPQTFVLHFQRKIKESFDPNALGDRNYPWLPKCMGQPNAIALS